MGCPETINTILAVMNCMKNTFINQLFTFLLLSYAVAGATYAHGDAKGPAKARQAVEEKAFGREGTAGKVTRTINVDMSDKLRFTPSVINVAHGETVRLAVKNSGKAMHELVLGTMAELREHAALMKRFPAMQHDDAHMAHVKPGATQTIIWQFTQAGEFYYGCLLPGHFEGGMVGKIVVK